MRRNILLIYLVLVLEDTWTEASYAWAFVVNSVGMRGSRFLFTNLSLMNVMADTLKESHASTNIEFMWQGKFFLSHISASTQTSPHFKEKFSFAFGPLS